MPYINRDGVNIYYETHGAGPAILLTHGFSATADMWGPQVDMLQGDHQVIVWDMRGHGRSDSPDDGALYGEPQTIADMAMILDATGVTAAIIGGHSLGGYMSLAFRNAYPERVSAMVLSGTGPGFRRDDTRAAWNIVANGMGDDIARGGLASLGGRSREMDPHHHKSVDGLVQAARHMLTQRDAAVLESLPAIAVPTLITVGRNDTNYLNGAKYMNAKIAGSEYHVFEDAGHAVNLDQAEAFNAVLGVFTARLRG